MKRVSSTRPRVRIRRTPVPSLVVAVQVTGTGARLGGQHVDDLVAGADFELAEDLAEVVLGSPRADEQPDGDLRVREAIAGQARDLGFLGRERSERPSYAQRGARCQSRLRPVCASKA